MMNQSSPASLQHPLSDEGQDLSRTKKRIRVLYIWYELPNRPELQEPFRNLSDQFDFIHLIYNTPKERMTNNSPFGMIYWFDFPTPYALLKTIKPDLIFSEFPSSLKTIAVTIAAKNKGIPVISMTHGIYFSNSFNIVIANENSLSSVSKWGHYLRIIYFYLSSIRPRNLSSLKPFLSFLYYFMRVGYFEALKKVKFELRWPDRYILYQLKNAVDLMKKTHEYPADRLIPIGVPQFDRLFQKWNAETESKESVSSDYYLMIDTAWIYNVDKPPIEIISGTYTRLAAFCRLKGCRLIVKLHPYWYDYDGLPQDANIVYVRNLPQDELADMMIRAKGCFLYFSTLSIPLVPYKHCYFLYYKTPSKDLQDIAAMKVAKALDIADINPSSINFTTGFNKEGIASYIDDYLYAIDGKATERLGQLLVRFAAGGKKA